MVNSSEHLTEAQNELYVWIKDYMKDFQHSPSIRQMMDAMGLKSPAPIQSRLKHLQEKGYISWQEGKARTLQLIDEVIEGNIKKLEKRYPGGKFDINYSEVRAEDDL